MTTSSKLALGLDLSTQQLKVIAIDISNLKTIYKNCLTFDKDLSHYKTLNGVYTIEETNEVYSPVEMWIEAVDVMLEWMKRDKFPFEKVVAISGAGQVQFYVKKSEWIATYSRILVKHCVGSFGIVGPNEKLERPIVPEIFFSSIFPELARSFYLRTM